MCVIPWLPCLQWYSEGLKGGCISTMSLWGRTATGEDVRTRQIWTRFSPHLCWLWFSFPKCANPAWLIQILHSVWLWLHCSVSTCELLHRLQPDTDGLVGEQRGGGQRARHALHYANVLHALGHGERGHSVVSLEGTVAVYAATCRMGGGDKTVWEAFLCVQQCIGDDYNTASRQWRSVWRLYLTVKKRRGKNLGLRYWEIRVVNNKQYPATLQYKIRDKTTTSLTNSKYLVNWNVKS